MFPLNQSPRLAGTDWDRLAAMGVQRVSIKSKSPTSRDKVAIEEGNETIEGVSIKSKSPTSRDTTNYYTTNPYVRRFH